MRCRSNVPELFRLQEADVAYGSRAERLYEEVQDHAG